MGTISIFALIIIAVIVVVIVVGCIIIASYWARIADVLKSIFGTSDIKAINEEGKRKAADRPKSISSYTAMALPAIQADFPEFNWPEFRIKCENTLKAALMAVSEQDLGYLKGIEGDIVNWARLTINEDRLEDERNFYRDIQVHRTEIVDYQKRDGLCIIKLQSAVGHIHWVERGGQQTSGDKNLPEQVKYDMELVYVQDPLKVRFGEIAIGVTCPNCGAAVPALGQKSCGYCGSAIEPINIRVWRFGALKKYGSKLA